ncbi:hypothetical protein PAXINDRAFT_171634 [Paxillus involutus ATCC 200175]|uniref:Uncharacterized protein n=1 Tax=Paxillus involutus ATCC 200175 TaxID=664439 RepID=A0A0C9TWN3_PAXIN|nr:hypothetical protein PAXINDRAFT_171634 [Paxillus involutus ATCC 200175]
MFIPLVTPMLQSIERRKGGGGGAKSTSGGKSTGGSPTSSKGGSTTGSGSSTTNSGSSGTKSGSSGKPTSVPLPASTASGKKSATAYGYGGGPSITIPVGQFFSGRTAGGGTRLQVFGTTMYGSGYPGISGRGVSGRGFPFWYWPVVWNSHSTTATYLDDTEYGDSFNTSRVGGPMAQSTFISNSMNTTFHVLSDNSTVSSLITSIHANCSSSLSSSSSSSPQPFNASAPGTPQPEQAIQYYRASSIVLNLDGYNNSATLSSDPNAFSSPLPSSIDMTLLDCLNQTIALAAPLIGGAGPRWSTGPSTVPLMGLVWLVWTLLSFF